MSPNNPSHVQTRETLSFPISRHTAARIRVFKDRLEKKLKRPITMEEVMKEFLRMAEADDVSGQLCKSSSTAGVLSDKVSEQRSDGAKRNPETSGIIREKIPEISPLNPKNDLSSCIDRHPQNNPSPCVSRHIPAAIRREIFRRYQGVCAFPNCNKPSKILHHTERFSLQRVHDPDTIVPLCVPHERIAHQSLIAYEEKAPSEWRILDRPDREHPKYAVDLLVQKYRKF